MKLKRTGSTGVHDRVHDRVYDTAYGKRYGRTYGMMMIVVAGMIMGMIMITLMASGMPLSAEVPHFVGAAKCKVCHSGASKHHVWERWNKAAHARAFETLKEKGQEKNPQCLPCHVTGYNKGGYKLGAPDAKKFEGVQCEACHGAGSLYMKNHTMGDIQSAVNNGLLIPIEVVCTKCHNKASPTFKGFNYDEYLKKIDHLYRKSY